MAPPRRKILETAQETLTPPDQLPKGHQIARIIRPTGNNVYSVELPTSSSDEAARKTTSADINNDHRDSGESDCHQVLVELPPRFRSTIWVKRGSYVLVDTNALQDRDNKLHGEIVNVVRDEKAWRKADYWFVFFFFFFLILVLVSPCLDLLLSTN